MGDQDIPSGIVIDHQGRAIRLTVERAKHILVRPEMLGQFERIRETLARPEAVVVSIKDVSVHVYHRFYPDTAVTRKHLQVAVKMLKEDAFVLTAFYSNRRKRGNVLWQV